MVLGVSQEKIRQFQAQKKLRRPRRGSPARTLLLLLVLVGTAAYYALYVNPAVLPPEWNVAPPDLREVASEVAQRAAPLVDEVRSRLPGGGAARPASAPVRRAARPSAPVQAAPAGPQVTLHLTNGGIVTGTLLRETPQALTLSWEYGEAVFERGEIVRLERGSQLPQGVDALPPPRPASAPPPEPQPISP
jgi:hypothetical protein